MKHLPRGEKSDKQSVATTRDMKKILLFLLEFGKSKRSEMRKGLGLNSAKINDGLLFLKRLEIVKENKASNGNSSKEYSLIYGEKK